MKGPKLKQIEDSPPKKREWEEYTGTFASKNVNHENGKGELKL